MRIAPLMVGLGVLLVAPGVLAEEPASSAAPPSAATPAAGSPTKSEPRRETRARVTRSDVAVGAALARLEDGVTLKSPVAPRGEETGPAGRQNAAAPEGKEGLSAIVVKSAANDKAGRARDVTLEGSKRTARPFASVRHERRLGVAKALAAARPQLDACRDPSASAPLAVSVRLDVAPGGEVEEAEATAAGATPLAKELATCLARAFVGTKLGAPGGQGVQVALPVTFGAAARTAGL